MTDLKQNEPTLETSTVDVNQDSQTAIVTSPKFKVEFRVGKSRYAAFFTISLGKGSAPSELSGKYSSLEKAVKAILNYIKNSNETFSVKSERLHQERQSRKHAKSDPSNSQQHLEGSDH